MQRDEATQFVTLLYKFCLRREAADEELEMWVKAVLGGLSASDVVQRFGDCEEYVSKNAVIPFWPPGHYYSPIVAPDDSVKRYIETQLRLIGSAPNAIDMQSARMNEFFKTHQALIETAHFSRSRNGSSRYFSENAVFPLADALVLRSMIHTVKPQRIVEIGSGFSTASMLDSIEELSLSVKLTCIEPFPDRLRDLLKKSDEIEIIEKKVQDLPLSLFSELASGDILFIDSTHVMKSGSDVHYELFSILPCIQPGVFIHFHDVPYPFEYPLDWVFKSNYSWNEAYAVRAFLMYNKSFSLVYSNSYMFMCEQAMIGDVTRFPANPGTSLWIQKIAW